MTVFLLGLKFGYGQHLNRDSLISIAESGDSRASALAYKDLARIASDSLPLHLQYARKGLAIAQRMNDRFVQANILMNLGVVHDMGGLFDQAIAYYDSAQTLFLDLGENEWLVSLYINYGVAHYLAGNNNIALDYYLQAYERSAKDISNENYSYLLNNIANIYQELEKPQEALLYYEKSLAQKQLRGDTLGYYNTLMNIGRSLAETKNFDNAIEKLLEAEQGFEQLNHLDFVQASQIYQAEILLQTGKPYQAYKLTEGIYKNKSLFKPKSREIEGLTIAGDAATQVLNLEKAKGYYKRATKLVEETGFQTYESDLLEKTAHCHVLDNDYPTAYHLLKQAREKEQEEIIDQRLQLEQEMQVKFRTLVKERDNLLLQNQNESQRLSLQRSRRTFWLLLLLLIAMAVLVTQSYLNRMRVQNLNNELIQQKSTIAMALREKETLLQEIHHRVKNNLQFVSSLLSLQSEHVKDVHALDALQGGQDRVQSMALIHQNLYQEDSLKGIDVKAYFEKLSQNLFDSYNVSEDRIKLNLDIDQISLDIDSVVPLGLIVNELISNALKHAFPNKAPGYIAVSLNEQDNYLHLTVSDNGIGINPQKTKTMGDSFGYRLIEAFKEQLEAEVEIKVDTGTSVTIKIREYKKAA